VLVGMREQLDAIFREALQVDAPDPSTDILDAGILDSLALVTLLFEIEQRFEVTIPLEQVDLDDLRTIDRIEALIDSLRHEQHPPPAAAESAAQ
jgi:methoxymalonate biosynthesis acyl carrier protein